MSHTLKPADAHSVVEVVRSRTMQEQLDWLEGHVNERLPTPSHIEAIVHGFGAYHAGRTVYGEHDPTAGEAHAPWCSQQDQPPPTSTDVARTTGCCGGDDRSNNAVCGFVKAFGSSALRDGAGPVKYVFQSQKAIKARASRSFDTADGVDPVLRGLWRLLTDGAVSPQAGWTALAVLTQASERNAVALAKHVATTRGVLPIEATGRRTTPCGSGSTRVCIQDEGEGVLCWIGMVDGARASLPMSNESVVAVGPPTNVAKIAAVPPSSAANDDGEPVDASAKPRAAADDTSGNDLGLQPSLPLLTPPVRAVIRVLEWLESNPYTSGTMRAVGSDRCLALRRYIEAGAFAATSDPLVATLEAVDKALTKEIARLQRHRYDFEWFSPRNWLYPLGKWLGLKHKPHGLTQLPEAQSSERFPAPLGRDLGGMVEGALPYTVPRKESTLIHVLSQTVQNRSLAQWLHTYTTNAAGRATDVSVANERDTKVVDAAAVDGLPRRQRSLADAVAGVMSVCVLLCTSNRVGRWMVWRSASAPA